MTGYAPRRVVRADADDRRREGTDHPVFDEEALRRQRLPTHAPLRAAAMKVAAVHTLEECCARRRLQPGAADRCARLHGV